MGPEGIIKLQVFRICFCQFAKHLCVRLHCQQKYRLFETYTTMIMMSQMAFVQCVNVITSVLSFLFSRSNNHLHIRGKIISRANPPADNKLVTWEGSCSNSFQQITLKTNPLRTVVNFDHRVSLFIYFFAMVLFEVWPQYGSHASLSIKHFL